MFPAYLVRVLPHVKRAVRLLVRCAGLAILLASALTYAQPLTLEQAWRIAEGANPALRTALGTRASAEGQLNDSRGLFWNNPELSLERARKQVPQIAAPSTRESEWRVGITQALEVAGQQRYRRQAATAEVAVVDATIAATRASLRSEVEALFVRVLALQQRVSLERATLEMVEQAAKSMARRLEVGEVNRLDSNLAAVEADRAHNQIVLIEEQLTQARAEFAALLQLPPEQLPEVSGDLYRGANYTLADLLAAASQRSQSQALVQREEAARSRLELERASRYPDVTVGLFSGREGPSELREDIVGVSISVPLPFFRRNETGIGRATSELAQAQIERQAGDRDSVAHVRAYWQRISQLEVRAKKLREAVLPRLEDNQRLSQIALREGEMGTTELLLVNRQVAEVRRDVLDAETELRLARIALEKAAGWPPNESREPR